MRAPRIPYEQLSPNEAALLNPAHWEGQTVGWGICAEYEPPHVTPAVAARARSAKRSVAAAWLLADKHPELKQTFGPGTTFRSADHIGSIVLLDQSTLLSREIFNALPEQFPPEPPFALPEIAPPKGAYYRKERRLRYLREYCPLVPVTSDPYGEYARLSSMPDRIGMIEYARRYDRQVGVLTLPDTMVVGNVTHYLMRDYQEMLTKTHKIIVVTPPVTG